MKKIISLIFVIAFALSLCSCAGNYGYIDLMDVVLIPENGVIEKALLEQIREKNAIATFQGVDGEYTYEWLIFGSDITDTKDINLGVKIERLDDGISVSFAEKSDFGFSALLSVYLNEKWSANSALVSYDGEKIASASITGSKNSILNFSVTDVSRTLKITPEKIASTQKLEVVETTAPVATAQTSTPVQKDDYLSGVKENDDKVYTQETSSYQPPVIVSGKDDYLSGVKESEDVVYSGNINGGEQGNSSGDRVYSEGNSLGKDKYNTDPVPEGKPMPVEPENQEIDRSKTYTCTFSIECTTILNNMQDLDPNKREMVPSGGVILAATQITFYEGESVYDVLQRVCKEYGIHMEATWTPIYNSAYVEGIHNLYEFDCGALSGWMYSVDGWYPNYGSSRYQLADGEVVEWRFTCDLGKDVGCDWLA